MQGSLTAFAALAILVSAALLSASLIKLRAARDRKKAEGGKASGRKSYAEARPDTVALAKQLHSEGCPTAK
jgi:hypothetical protein